MSLSVISDCFLSLGFGDLLYHIGVVISDCFLSLWFWEPVISSRSLVKRQCRGETEVILGGRGFFIMDAGFWKIGDDFSGGLTKTVGIKTRGARIINFWKEFLKFKRKAYRITKSCISLASSEGRFL